MAVRTALLAAGVVILTPGCVSTPPAPMDQLSAVSQAARQLAPGQAQPQWQSTLPGDALDILLYLDEEHVLVGSLMSPEVHALPRHGPLSLVNTRTGKMMWSAERPELPTGHYQVVATQPAILLHGVEGSTNIFMALDPAAGRVLWKQKFEGATAAAAASQGDGLFVASRQESGGLRIARLGFRSGKGWSTTLKPGSSQGSDAPLLLQDARRVYCVAESVAALDARQGRLLWRATPGDGHGTVSTQLLASGLLWADAGHMALLDPASGKARWSVKTASETAELAADAKRVYRLGRSATGNHVVEAYAVSNGRRLWSHDMAERLASGLAPAGERLWFSDTESLRALDAASGKAVVDTRLSRRFAENGPYEFTRGGQLDTLVVGDEHIELVRELAGVMAVSRSTGRVLWEQALLPGSNAYAVSTKSNLIQSVPVPRAFEGATARLQALGTAAAREVRSGQGTITGGPSSHYDSGLDHRIAQINIANSRTLLQSQVSHTQSMGTTTMDIVRARAEQGQEMQRLGMAFGSSLGELILAIRSVRAKVMSEKAQGQAEAKLMAWSEGKMQRYTMESLAAFSYHQDAVQGHYMVRPYAFPVTPALVDGAALTLVDLATGKRSELVYAVVPFAQNFHGFNMPAYAVSPSGHQVLASGIGLEPSRYEPYTQWYTLLPRQSLMAYSTDKLAFADEAPADIRKRVQTGAATGDEDLAAYALAGRIGGVRRMLAAGVKPDATMMANTPLASAAYVADVAIVNLLLAHGADPNRTGKSGWTPLEAARQGEMLRNGAYDEVRRLLVAAGAKPL